MGEITKNMLTTLCKQNGIKNYSKMKKDQLIELLEENKVKIPNTTENSPEKKSKATTKAKPKENKQRFEKLDKKLAKAIDTEEYMDNLKDFKETIPEIDVKILLEKEIKDFINSDTLKEEDYKKYVDSKGFAVVLVDYLKSNKTDKLKGLTVEQLYKLLASFIYNDDTDVIGPLVKKFQKCVVTLNKPPKETKSKSKKPSEKKATKGGSKKKSDESESSDDSLSIKIDSGSDEEEEEED
jgi:hypothetical protein